jgi:hypothetical protein
MTLSEILLAIVLSLPAPWYKAGNNPETPSAYQSRLETIAKAIAMEAEAAEDWRWDASSLAAATLVIWYGESRFALEVHNGSGKSRYGEDDGKARCFGQLHQTGLVPRDEWQSLTGIDLEATRRCARATMRVLSVQGRRCGMQVDKPSMWAVARMVSAYGSGKKSCAPTKDSTARARRWAKVMERIKAASASAELAQGREG